jgi:1,4-alpha-glucan branching enzyme
MGGSLCLILHAHLPFVRHPEHDAFFEENWLFEAITETHLPLLDCFDGLDRDGVPYRIAVSLSPTLLAMLDDDLLRRRYERHLESRLRFARAEIDRTRLLPEVRRIAERSRDALLRARTLWHERHRGDLVSAYREAARRGRVELFTTAATHAYLPLMLGRRSSWRAQIRTGIDAFESRLGFRPAGFWLPECGFVPGVDDVLAENGVRWFVVDAHGFLFAESRPRSGPYAPVLTPAGVAAFGRDPESSRQVWSDVEGYPGDPAYLDFHEDPGWSLPWDYVSPHLPGSLGRAPTGMRYHRVTGRGVAKETYDVEKAKAKCAEHAAHFVEARRAHACWLEERLGHEVSIVAPYDAELFGHWWREGPEWLERVIRSSAAAGPGRACALRTPTDVLDRFPRPERSMPAASSWGEGGYNALWCDETNHWIHPPLHEAAARMEALVAEHPAVAPRTRLRRALDQAGRELLLAQASDWPFILHVQTVPEYAARRVSEHLDAFFELERAIRERRLDRPDVRERLAFLEDRDRPFPSPPFDHRVFRPDPPVRPSTVRAGRASTPDTVTNDIGRQFFTWP